MNLNLVLGQYILTFACLSSCKLHIHCFPAILALRYFPFPAIFQSTNWNWKYCNGCHFPAFDRIYKSKWRDESMQKVWKHLFVHEFKLFWDKNMVAKYQTKYQGICSGKVLDVSYGIVTTHIMYFCNFSGTMLCTDMYNLSL